LYDYNVRHYEKTDKMVGSMLNILKYKRLGLLVLITVILFSLLTCSASPSEVVTIRELFACQGPDKAGKPVGIATTFSAKEKRIYACDRLETYGPPLAIVVYWFYEGELISRQVIADVTDDFYSYIEPEGEAFAVGHYKIDVVIDRTHVQQVEFSVEQP